MLYATTYFGMIEQIKITVRRKTTKYRKDLRAELSAEFLTLKHTRSFFIVYSKINTIKDIIDGFSHNG